MKPTQIKPHIFLFDIQLYQIHTNYRKCEKNRSYIVRSVTFLILKVDFNDVKDEFSSMKGAKSEVT